MASALRGLSATAKASLTDYTRQLDKATGADSAFTRNLATLAARGYGDLAKQLAAQGDPAAEQLAAAAVGDKKKAAAANTSAKKANSALTGDEVDQLIAIIAAIKTSKTGIHSVADTTGLGEDAIIAIATKAQAQIKSSLGDRSTKFIADLGRATKGLSYANGGSGRASTPPAAAPSRSPSPPPAARRTSLSARASAARPRTSSGTWRPGSGSASPTWPPAVRWSSSGRAATPTSPSPLSAPGPPGPTSAPRSDAASAGPAGEG
ncbi:hypothetical protein [Streptomyces microflavus]|uniref:hypothetical protein n=1 Tax=Streptomyces microflavus TaxID=1919 RepID=UPI003B20D635